MHAFKVEWVDGVLGCSAFFMFCLPVMSAQHENQFLTFAAYLLRTSILISSNQIVTEQTCTLS